MAWTYYIYTTLSLTQARALEDQYSKDFDRFLDENPEIANSDEGTGMVFVSTNVPSPDAVDSVNKEFGLPTPSSLLERLAECHSVIEIENPFPPDSSRLQVSTLMYLLELTGTCVMDWGDFQLQSGEKALLQMKQMENFGPISRRDDLKVAEEKKTAPKKTAEGEIRATRIVDLFHMAEESHDLAIDLQRLISRQPELSQKYLAHLFSHGPVGDAEAASALGVELKTLAPLLKELESRVDQLVDL
jgi:hypothetical protein